MSVCLVSTVKLNSASTLAILKHLLKLSSIKQMFALKNKILNSTSSSSTNGGGTTGGSGSTKEGKDGTAKEQQLFAKSRIVPKSEKETLKSKEELEISDIVDDDDSDDGPSGGSIRSTTTSLSNQSFVKISSRSRSIEHETAKKLKILLIGDSTKVIGPEWSYQYFEFNSQVPELWYGLSQSQGGPCGLLATLQGYLCAELFHQNRIDPAEMEVDLDGYRYRCLAQAIARLLWQIGGHKQKVIVAFETNQTTLNRLQLPETSDFKPDGITERIRLSEFRNDFELAEFVEELFAYDRQCIGCVSLAYSCILTRGVDQIRHDYDSGSIESLLTPERLLCSQELINLALIGRAVSNVFDRNFALSSEMILQGINRQSIVGFLTIHEHDGAFKVGACYKNPKLPIYVVLSEYHFTLLFSKQKVGDDDNQERRRRSSANIKDKNSSKFDLFYYDGLLGQDQEILLTIETDPADEANGSVHSSEDSFLGPCPIECVIRTKWPNASIDWNGASKLF